MAVRQQACHPPDIASCRPWSRYHIALPSAEELARLGTRRKRRRPTFSTDGGSSATASASAAISDQVWCAISLMRHVVSRGVVWCGVMCHVVWCAISLMRHPHACGEAVQADSCAKDRHARVCLEKCVLDKLSCGP
jgi:hypothetical protein